MHYVALRRLRPYVRPHLRQLAVMTAAALVGLVMGALVPLVAMAVVDGPTEVHKVTVARQVLRDYAPTEALFPAYHRPTAAAAATCILGQPGATCVNNGDCCSNSCVDNGRGFFQCT